MLRIYRYVWIIHVCILWHHILSDIELSYKKINVLRVQSMLTIAGGFSENFRLFIFKNYVNEVFSLLTLLYNYNYNIVEVPQSLVIQRSYII